MARMMAGPMRTNMSDAYSHPSPGYSYSRNSSNISAYSYTDDEESAAVGSTPPPRQASRFAPRPPSSPLLNRLSMKKNVDVSYANNKSEEQGYQQSFKSVTSTHATIFGTCHKLEPLPPEKKSMWRREMDCFLSVCDFILDPSPTEQTMPGGHGNEIMAAKPRMDIMMNLPALEKLENMLLDILDSFHGTEFWYADQKKQSFDNTNSNSFHRSEDKWWVPVPCLPGNGLPERARKELQQKRECANQIHKAAMAINNAILGEMDVPESYLTTLPKTGRQSVGDVIYRHMQTTEQFSADHVLNSLNISAEHEALEIADKVEAALYIWKRKVNVGHTKSTWDMGLVSDFMADGDKNTVLLSRAQSLLLALKHQFPSLSQTTLDTSKIQYNKDVGQAILESYSRVLESLAFNIVSWIDDVLLADDAAKKGN
ncbi:hypothetical protein LUZ63_011443 [Rhynchospora breviuscula]|uniref:PRONE domain-containing protein n=1 Tax=Rhynchospora breviuscula TaxID=2022672 RepID=A0A9Q0CJ73_9POAL|nr:hypothetical protein LUZ63_011443 [Rhynchospora breviuscula]